MKNVVLYTRNSTRLQEKNKTHEQHFRILRKYCEKSNLNIMNEYIDKAVSGTKKNRSAFDSMFLFLETNFNEKTKINNVDTVLITKLDRFMRSIIHFYSSIEKLIKYNVGLVAIEQSDQLNLTDLSNISSKIFISNLALFADVERTFIVERTQAGKEDAKITGTKSGLPMHRPRKELDLKGIKEDYEARVSVSAMARKYKVSRPTINDRLKEMGLK